MSYSASPIAAASSLPSFSYNPLSPSLDDIFKIDEFESEMTDAVPSDFAQSPSQSFSHSHSPTTISPNHTPSPLPLGQDVAFDMGDFDFNYESVGSNLAISPKAPLGGLPIVAVDPTAPPASVSVKQEPIDFSLNMPPLPVAAAASSSQAAPDPNRFDGWTPEQINALSQLITHLAQYNQAANPTAPATVQPSAIFSSSPMQATSAQTSTSANSLSVSPVAATSIPSVPAAPVMNARPRRSASPEDDEPLRALEEDANFDRPLGNIDEAIDNLVPLGDIFSAGRGKGGKKGGGVSSVVRGEDEDLDDDDSWRPSAEEYKKLSSKEKRQLRNKLSARAFRNRRKDYIGMLEGHIKDRDTIIDSIRTQLISSRSETEDLRRELDELKRNTMQVLHPETTKPSPSPMLGAFAASSGFVNAAAGPGPSSLKRPGSPTSTIQINKRKDLPASSALYGSEQRGFWGGNDLGGGSTMIHTLFTPDIVLPTSASASAASGFPSGLRPFDMPRQNLNPRLNDAAHPSSIPTPAAKDRSDMSSPFADWAESTPFSLRSMDAYRMQMWSRLAREAQAEKAGMAQELRPKFYVEPKAASMPVVATATVSAAATSTATPAASAAADKDKDKDKAMSSKLAASFWSAFQSPGGHSTGKMDNDRLAQVVQGLGSGSGAGRSKTPSVGAGAGAGAGAGEEDGLAALLGGLKLVAGPGREGVRMHVHPGARADPLGTLGSWLGGAAGQARA